MQATEIESELEGFPPAELALAGVSSPGSAATPSDPVWSGLARRMSRLSTSLRVQANALGVPALATLLMQGLVL
jgi:hypothetical protein